jgi:uncharacterized membrane protein YidH (DUF202 family)
MEPATNHNNDGNEKNPLLNGKAHEYPPPNKALSGILIHNKASFFLPKAGVVTNIGSTARDHLANERTYLAWIRTSLALIGASIGLLKWDASNSVEGYLVGLTGVVALITSTYRYFHVMQLLQEGRFEPNVTSILIVVVIVSVTIATAFVIHYEKTK